MNKRTKTPLGVFLEKTGLTQSRFAAEWEKILGLRLMQERVSEWSRVDGARPGAASRVLIARVTTAISRKLARKGVSIAPVVLVDWSSIDRRKSSSRGVTA